MSAAALALAAYLTFLGVAFVGRTWLQYRRTGDARLRSFRRRPAELAVLGRFVSGLLAAPLSLLGVLLSWWSPLGALATAPLRAAGLGLLSAGFALTVLAQLAMGASWRIGLDPREQTALVTRSVFAHVRDPSSRASCSCWPDCSCSCRRPLACSPWLHMGRHRAAGARRGGALPDPRPWRAVSPLRPADGPFRARTGPPALNRGRTPHGR
jgi:hypothetical protein